MRIVVVNFVPKPDTPKVPAPFLADGNPSWVAVLSHADYLRIKKVIMEPSEKFIAEIESVHVNGKQVYPHP